MINVNELVESAKNASANSYSPYSNYKVGAALLTSDGEIFTGTNVENISYSATTCAERIAVFSAVSQGYTEFDAIAVYHDGEDLPYPCGVCLQVLSEFVLSDEFKIFVASDSAVEEYCLSDLLPIKFKGDFNV